MRKHRGIFIGFARWLCGNVCKHAKKIVVGFFLIGSGLYFIGVLLCNMERHKILHKDIVRNRNLFSGTYLFGKKPFYNSSSFKIREVGSYYCHSTLLSASS